MSSGLDSPHRVLKDDTRRKIVLLLNEKSSLGFAGIFQMLGLGNTGTLNYHLKSLSDLLIKNEEI
jgi:predicted transcriptional regulator